MFFGYQFQALFKHAVGGPPSNGPGVPAPLGVVVVEVAFKTCERSRQNVANRATSEPHCKDELGLQSTNSIRLSRAGCVRYEDNCEFLFVVYEQEPGHLDKLVVWSGILAPAFTQAKVTGGRLNAI